MHHDDGVDNRNSRATRSSRGGVGRGGVGWSGRVATGSISWQHGDSGTKWTVLPLSFSQISKILCRKFPSWHYKNHAVIKIKCHATCLYRKQVSLLIFIQYSNLRSIYCYSVFCRRGWRRGISLSASSQLSSCTIKKAVGHCIGQPQSTTNHKSINKVTKRCLEMPSTRRLVDVTSITHVVYTNLYIWFGIS